jgi:hypothetical protein
MRCLANRFEFRGLQAACDWRPPVWSEPLKRRELGLWRKRVAAIPSLFGRLTYLASLRNADTGRYEHSGLGFVLGDAHADEALRAAHREAFAEWLTLDLKSQHAALELFLSNAEGHRRQVLATCSAPAAQSCLIPEGTPEHESRLYLADLQAILQLLAAEYGLTETERPAPAALGPLATENGSR